MTRLYRLLSLVNDVLGEYNPVIRVVEHYVDVEAGIEYVNVRVIIPYLDALLVLREYWKRRILIAYGYYVRVGVYEEWWDNRPHHPEVETFPHHRHVGDSIYPLQNPSLEAFLNRVKELQMRD